MKASGCIITDSNGKEYIDFTGGFGLFNVGHNNERIIAKLKEQLDKKELFNRPLIARTQIKAAKLLAKLAPSDLEVSAFVNSGSEAVEFAIKLVKLIKKNKKIITFENSFYGLTLGALSASGISKFQKSFAPLLDGFSTIPMNDLNALEKALQDDVGAVIIEPIQHENGVVIPSKEYMQELNKKCKEKDILLIFDEIITGVGKTGYLFSYEHFEIVPDILLIGKSLGAGLIPVGAVLTKSKSWNKVALSFPMFASSYSGNVIACRAAIETLNYVRDNDLPNQSKIKGRYFLDRLVLLKDKYPDLINRVDGLGLLISIELNNQVTALEIVKEMISGGVLVLQALANSSVIMIEPPLVISKDQIDYFLGIFENACQKFNKNNI